MNCLLLLRRFSLFLVASCLAGTSLLAAEKIPAKPERYFTDAAHAVSAGVSDQINSQLEQFEKDTSDQILVAIYPKMETDSSIEDYTVRIAQSWHAGQKGKDNGAVLFVFIQDRKMYIQVGYGLEGALPDARCKQIIEDEIKPRFRTGDYEGGIRAGVDALLAAARGEYQGTGTTVAQGQAHGRKGGGYGFVIVFAIIILLALASSRRRRYGYWGGGWGGWTIGSGGFSGGSGGWSSGGGGGGFSSGGGSFGGGGAGGSW